MYAVKKGCNDWKRVWRDLWRGGKVLLDTVLVWWTWWVCEKPLSCSHHKEWNNAICSSMGGPGDYHTKWSQRKTNFIWYHLCVESKKKKWYQWIYLQNRNRLTHLEKKCLVYHGGGVGQRDSLGLTYTHCSI